MRKILALLFALVFLTAGASNDPWMRFRHIDMGDGLPSNCILSLQQDHLGVMWVGTDRGIFIYEGIRFTRLPDLTAPVPVYALHESGNLMYLGTERGLFCYNFLEDSVHTVLLGSSVHVSMADVTDLAESRDSTLWVSTAGSGLFCLSPDGTRRNYMMPDGDGNVSGVFVDSSDRIWAFNRLSSEAPLALFDRDSLKFEAFPLTDVRHKPVFGRGVTMCEADDHTLWLGTWDDGVLSFNPDTHEAEQILSSAHPSVGHIRSMMRYDDSLFLVGSDCGLVLFNPATGFVHSFAVDHSDPQSLSNQFVSPMMRDREGGIWIGTIYGGISYASPGSNVFTTYVVSCQEDGSSASGSVANGFAEGDDGRIWVATSDCGLCLFDPATEQFRPVRMEGNNHRHSSSVQALAIRAGEVWTCTYEEGLEVYDMQTHRCRHYPQLLDVSDNVLCLSCHSMLCDGAQQLWIGTSSGVCLYDPTTDRFRLARYFGVAVTGIRQASDGVLWFCTRGRGLWSYDPRTEHWHQYYKWNDHSYGRVTTVAFDLQGRLWAGTPHGLYCINDSDEVELVPLLPDDSDLDVRSIVADSTTLWLGTSSGLIRYNLTDDGHRLHVFTQGDGLTSVDYTPGGAFRSSVGRLYFGTTSGITVFSPRQVAGNEVTPNIVFTGLEVSSRARRIYKPEFSVNLNLGTQIDLDYTEDEIFVTLAALSYCQPEKNQYAYYLEGFDDEWIRAGNRNQIVYTHLSPGRYTLHAKAANNNGIWSDNEATLRLVIHPPFYWNVGSIMIYLLLILFVVFWLLNSWRKRSELAHQRKIEEVREENNRRMQESRIHFFTIIAHEIRTPVSLIISPLQKVLSQSSQLPAEVQTNLSVVDRNSRRLLDLVNQLLDFRKMGDGPLHIHPRPTALRPLLEGVTTNFENAFHDSGISFSATYPSADFTACVDGEAMVKLVSNLLSNAQKYASSRVTFSCGPLLGPSGAWPGLESADAVRYFEICVTNDGPLVSDSDREKIFRPFYQADDSKPGTGIGLSIVKNIVSAHQGHIDLQSELVSGTTFRVLIPSNLKPCEEDAAEVLPAGTGAKAVSGKVDDTPTAQPQSADSASDDTTATTSAATASEPTVPAAAPADTRAKSAQTTGGKPAERPVLLLVDDNADMVGFLSDSLSVQFEVLTARDGSQALATLEAHRVDIIVSDWMMPVMDGLQLCAKVRDNAATSHIPFILLTARTDDESKLKGVDSGVDVYVEKPFSLEYLQACALNLVRMRKLLAEKYRRQPLEPIGALSPNSADAQFLSSFEKLVERHFADTDINHEAMARELGMSRTTYYNKIRVLTGMSPSQMIQIVRLKHAARMLQEGATSISEVCYEVGFTSPSYFAKCFQHQFGVKPSEFVANAKKKS